MNNEQMIKIYNTIFKVINNRRISQYTLVKELTSKYRLEIEDLHHDLFCLFIEEHSKKPTNEYYYNYIKTFCFYRLLDMKKKFAQKKRAEDAYHHIEYDDNINYKDYNIEDIYIKLIDNNK
jgi:hypothetical protein